MLTGTNPFYDGVNVIFTPTTRPDQTRADRTEAESRTHHMGDKVTSERRSQYKLNTKIKIKFVIEARKRKYLYFTRNSFSNKRINLALASIFIFPILTVGCSLLKI